MRTLVDLPEASLARLDAVASREKRSRASLIRELIDDGLASREGAGLRAAFGAWKGVGDGLEYQRRIRSEWPD